MIYNEKKSVRERTVIIMSAREFFFRKTGRPDFHTCNVSAVKSARYKLRGKQQSAVTLISVFGKRGEL